MKQVFITLIALLSINLLNAQVSNDDRCSAQHLGTFLEPITCDTITSIRGKGDTIIFSGTNLGATAEAPYGTMAACQTGQDMANPAADVWYSFVNNANELEVKITGNLNQPNIGLYEPSTNCNSLVPRFCAVGTDSLVANFSALTLGKKYYVQISGGNVLDQGDFQVTFINYNDCSQCLISSELEINPLVTGGYLPPNTDISFCYHVYGYNQVSTNWIHGIVPIFNDGWDLTTLSVIPPDNSCDTTGAWGWYENIHTENGLANGFFFNDTLFFSDDDPSDNYGDNCGEDDTLSFCWSIRTMLDTTNNGTNLGITIENYADGETGSWSNLGCAQDPNYVFIAELSDTVTTFKTMFIKDKGVGIYPNPFSNETNLFYQVRNQSNVRLEVYNLVDERVLVEDYGNKVPGAYSVKISSSDLENANGVYIVKMIIGNDVHTTRIIENR